MNLEPINKSRAQKKGFFEGWERVNMGRHALYFLPQAFFIHGILDIAAAVVLFIIPRVFIRLDSFPVVADGIISVQLYSLVLAAGLMAIGSMSIVDSFESNLYEFRRLLEGKMIWSFFMTMAHVIYIVKEMESSNSVGWPIWVVFAIFTAGFILWTSYRLSLDSIFGKRRKKRRRRNRK